MNTAGLINAHPIELGKIVIEVVSHKLAGKKIFFQCQQPHDLKYSDFATMVATRMLQAPLRSQGGKMACKMIFAAK